MARLAATGHTELGFDSVMPVFSIIQESSALGCKIQWEQKDNWPTVKMKEPIYETPDDIRVPDDLLEHPDTKCVLDAIKLLRKQFGDEVAIIGKTMGPWSLAYHTFGVEPFLLMSLDDPAKTALVLERLKEATIVFGKAQIEAGADALTLPDHATGDLVSGDYYRRYLRDMHHEFAEELDAPIILHICGRTVDRMGFIAETGMAAFHYDSKNGAAESMAEVDGRISLVGNINNPSTLYSKGPAEVRDEVRENLEAGVQMIGPECAIPLQTPIENLLRDPQGRRRVARRAAGCRERCDMPELSDVANDFLRAGDRGVHRAARRARAADRAVRAHAGRPAG